MVVCSIVSPSLLTVEVEVGVEYERTDLEWGEVVEFLWKGVRLVCLNVETGGCVCSMHPQSNYASQVSLDSLSRYFDESTAVYTFE